MSDKVNGETTKTRFTDSYVLLNVLALVNCFDYAVAWGGSTLQRIFTAAAGVISSLAVVKFSAQTVTRRARNPDIASAVISGAVIIVTNFATIYWIYGSTANFGHRLSKIGALYFALGIFTTAGTGPLAPISQFAQAIVSFQYVIDLVFVGWIIAVAISRLGAEPVS